MTAKNKTCDSTDKFSTAFEAVAWIFNAAASFGENHLAFLNFRIINK